MSIIDHLAITGCHPRWCDPRRCEPGPLGRTYHISHPRWLETLDQLLSFELRRLDERGPGRTGIALVIDSNAFKIDHKLEFSSVPRKP